MYDTVYNNRTSEEREMPSCAPELGPDEADEYSAMKAVENAKVPARLVKGRP